MKKILILICTLINIIFITNAQNKSDNYRRNSLCVGVITGIGENSYGIDDEIREAALDYRVSDKYNDHNIGISSVNLGSIQITQPEIEAYREAKLGSFFTKLNKFTNTLAAATGTPQVTNQTSNTLSPEDLTELKLQKFLDIHHVAPRLIAKWFNASDSKKDDSFYDMELIKERGAYNASELDKLLAKESVRGLNIVKDAGMELIPNTYVALIELKMESATEVLSRLGQLIDKRMTQAGSGMAKVMSKANTKTNAAEVFSQLGGLINNEYQKEARSTAGYYITATTYLYKLDWDENKENVFFSKYYASDPAELISSNDFKLKYIASSTNESKFTESTSFNGINETNFRLIKRAAVDAIDKSIAALQKKYEDFKVKTPLIDVFDDGATAFIGYKEGINESSKFEVLEKIYDEKKNRFKYKKVGSLKIDGNNIWDNRLKIQGLESRVGDKEDGIRIAPSLNRTILKGSTKNLAPGMLLRQTN